MSEEGRSDDEEEASSGSISKCDDDGDDSKMSYCESPLGSPHKPVADLSSDLDDEVRQCGNIRHDYK